MNLDGDRLCPYCSAYSFIGEFVEANGSKHQLMRQIRLFYNTEWNTDRLTQEVNEWIVHQSINVVDVKIQLAPQSPGGPPSPYLETPQSDLVCMVIYEV